MSTLVRHFSHYVRFPCPRGGAYVFELFVRTRGPSTETRLHHVGVLTKTTPGNRPGCASIDMTNEMVGRIVSKAFLTFSVARAAAVTGGRHQSRSFILKAIDFSCDMHSQAAQSIGLQKTRL